MKSYLKHQGVKLINHKGRTIRLKLYSSIAETEAENSGIIYSKYWQEIIVTMELQIKQVFLSWMRCYTGISHKKKNTSYCGY